MKESVIYQDWLTQGRQQGQASLISSQYVIRSLTEAGILDEQGNVRKFNFCDR